MAVFGGGLFGPGRKYRAQSNERGHAMTQYAKLTPYRALEGRVEAQEDKPGFEPYVDASGNFQFGASIAAHGRSGILRLSNASLAADENIVLPWINDYLDLSSVVVLSVNNGRPLIKWSVVKTPGGFGISGFNPTATPVDEGSAELMFLVYNPE